jgi:hypothetical protein
MPKYKTSTFLITVRHDADYSPKFIRQDIKATMIDRDEVKSFKINNAPLDALITQVGESTKMLRQLRQYASHIRNQVMKHHKALSKTEVTYIDLDTLDDVSVICMKNVQALESVGVARAALQHYLRRGA